MRLDHYALRVPNRYKTAEFYINSMGYRLAEGDGLTNGGFKIEFDDGSTANCLILEPPEKNKNFKTTSPFAIHDCGCEYHIPADIFISDSIDDNGIFNTESIVGQWVKSHKDKGYLHHMAFMVNDVEATMKEWQEKGFAEFATEKPIVCPGELIQCFTRPSTLTGIIYELITRETKSFCQKSVKQLMLATADNK